MKAQRKQIPEQEIPAVSHPCPACQSPVFQPLMAGRYPVCPICDTPWNPPLSVNTPAGNTLIEVA